MDKVRKKDIEQFLNNALILYQSNPNYRFDHRVIYQLLMRDGVKDIDLDNNGNLKNIKYNFEYWDKYFKNRPNLRAFYDENWAHFYQFKNVPKGKSDREYFDDKFIKLYIPLDSNHLTYGVDKIFDYLSSKNVYHISKVGDEARADNVIVRLKEDDYQGAMDLINFINNDSYLKSGLNKNNPFVPSIDGIGIMKEDGISYNSEIAKSVDKFIKNHINDRKVTYEEFSSELPFLTNDKDVVSIYNSSEPEYKVIDRRQEEVLKDAIIETYQKYGVSQAKGALLSAVKENNYRKFTRGSNCDLRGEVMNRLGKSGIISVIRNNVLEYPQLYNQNMNIDELCNSYCDVVLMDEQLSILNDICSVTLENYNEGQLNRAINHYINDDDSSYFSRFSNHDITHKVNYRHEIEKIPKEDVLNTMVFGLKKEGFNTDNMSQSDIIMTYANNLSKNRIFDEERKRTA